VWDYDAWGNLLGGGAWAGPAEPNGKLIHVPGVQDVDYDGAGRLRALETLMGGPRTLNIEYNVEGQPVSVSSTGHDPVSLEYGVGAQLLSRTEHQGGSEITDVYVGGYRARYKDDLLQEEYVTLSAPTGPLGTILWSSTGAAIEYVLTDNLGSGERTYSSGGTFLEGDERTYDAWGNARSAEWGYSDGPDADACFSESEVGYTGHRATADAGLIDMGLRHYDPSMRRFTSPDPVIPNPLDPQSWNRYAYARGNPTTLVDPNGAAPYDPWSGTAQCDVNCSGGAGGPVGTIGVGIVLLQRNWGDIGRGLRDIGRRARNLFDRGGNGSTPPPMQMAYVPTATNSINFINSYTLSMPTSLGGTANVEGHGPPAAGLSFGVAGLESAMNYFVGAHEASGMSPFSSFAWMGELGIGSIDPWSSDFQSGETHANYASLAAGGWGVARSLTRFGGNVVRQGVREWFRQSARPAVSRARSAVSSRLRSWFGRAAKGGANKGPIPDQVPENLTEQLVLAEAKATPKGAPAAMTGLADSPRLEANYGAGTWAKMETVHKVPNNAGQVNVHWFRNQSTGQNVEFKFKFRLRDKVGVKKPPQEPVSPTGTWRFP